jgi:hypothetical protein
VAWTLGLFGSEEREKMLTWNGKQPTILFWLGPRVLWYLGRDQQVQVIGLAEHTIAQDVKKLEWTVLRIPILTDDGSKPVHAGYTGDGKAKTKLSRQSLAEWCLEELEAKKWVGRAPFLSNF